MTTPSPNGQQVLEVLDRARRLTRILSFALRHNPESVGVKVDRSGWTPLQRLVDAIRLRSSWVDLSINEVELLVQSHTFSRFEIRDGNIRALYGHTLMHVSIGIFTQPPELLFHATRASSFNAISQGGLNPKSRRHVHLTSSWEYALNVKNDHEQAGCAGIILGVRTAIAQKGAIPFFQASDVVWTTPYVFPAALVLVTVEDSRMGRPVPLVAGSESALDSLQSVACFDSLLRTDDASN